MLCSILRFFVHFKAKTQNGFQKTEAKMKKQMNNTSERSKRKWNFQLQKKRRNKSTRTQKNYLDFSVSLRLDDGGPEAGSSDFLLFFGVEDFLVVGMEF